MTDVTPDAAADAIQRYMTALHNPDDLIDQERIANLQDKLASSNGVERLLIRAELREASAPPIEDAERAFLEVAKDWAAANNVMAEDFVMEGIPEEIVKRAKIPGRGALASTSSSSSGRRTTRVSGELIAAALRQVADENETFTADDVEAASGGARTSVLRYGQRAVDEGWLERVSVNPAIWRKVK